MSFKTFTCVVCGAEITKPQSYAVEGGRACRNHQVAQDAYQTKMAAQEAKEVKKATIMRETEAIKWPTSAHILYTRFDERKEVDFIKNIRNIVSQRSTIFDCAETFDNIAIEVFERLNKSDSMPHLMNISDRMLDYAKDAMETPVSRMEICVFLKLIIIPLCDVTLCNIESLVSRYKSSQEAHHDILQQLCKEGIDYCQSIARINDDKELLDEERMHRYMDAVKVFKESFEDTVSLYNNLTFEEGDPTCLYIMSEFKSVLGVYVPKFRSFSETKPCTLMEMYKDCVTLKDK